MRIYSKFKDYYDSIVPYDKTGSIWERKTKSYCISNQNISCNSLSLKLNNILFSMFSELPRISISHPKKPCRKYDDFTMVVGFCGKMYAVIVQIEIEGESEFPSKTQNIVKNSFLNYSEFMRAKYSLHPDVLFFDYFAYLKSLPFTSDGFKQWSNKYQNYKGIDDLFVELNSPVFIVHPKEKHFVFNSKMNLTVNPCMSDLKLQRVFHPFTAYQDIDVYLGNELAVCENANINRSDELIRDSKGFDNWSFRQKGPKSRKNKKCKS